MRLRCIERMTITPESQNNPYISALTWSSVAIAFIAVVLVVTASGIDTQASALPGETASTA
jgi:hypothetical protein